MATQITSDNFEKYFLQAQEQFSDALEQAEGARGCDIISDPDSVMDVLSMPGVIYTADPTTDPQAKADRYVQVPYRILADAVADARKAAQDAEDAVSGIDTSTEEATQAAENANTAAETARTAASAANASRQQIEAGESTRQTNEAGRVNAEKSRVSAETARSSAESSRVSAENSRVSAENSRASAETARVTAENARNQQATSDHNQYTADHSVCVTATLNAEKVDAQLQSQNGIISIKVTDRNGNTTTKEVGFRVHKTYASIAAMNADAANVEEGKFVMITSNVEDPDNAKLYAKGASSFSFVTDLSGAQGMKGDTPVMTASSDGILYADGVELTRIIKTTVESVLANEGTENGSKSGDGTRWGAYKSAEAARGTAYSTAEGTRNSQYSTAEQKRDSDYSTAEGSRDSQYSTAEQARDTARLNAEGTSSSAAGDGTRWGAYKTAEVARNTSYAGAEGSSASTAGDGTRWGTFKTNEAQRQSDFSTAQTSRDTAWTNWFSDSLSTGVRKLWNDFWSSVNTSWNGFFGTSAEDTNGVRKIWSTWYNATQTAWNDWFGTSSTTGVQKDWAGLKSDAQADHTRAGSDHNTATADHTTATGDHNIATDDTARAAADRTRAAADHTRAESDHTRAESDHSRAETDNSRADTDHNRNESDHTRAESDHARAEADHTTAAADHVTATGDHSTAVVDHTNVQGAENVNAELEGMTVTITNRQGTKTSVNIGFEIYRTYGSIAAMNADAANVPQGKFVMIATTDPTSTENAQLWARNDSAASGANPFTFLSDLDQASTAAWADWLESMKPAINERITTADNDHTRADSDHTRAETDHTTFVTQEAQRQQTFETNETSRQTAFTTNETARQTEWTTLSREVTQATGDATAAAGNADAAADLATDAATEAEVKAQDAYQATIEARKVNADLDGTVLTVWNRYGGTKSTNLQGPKGDKGDGLNWGTMTEEDKEAVINTTAQKVEEDMTFASVQTCEDIIEELT